MYKIVRVYQNGTKRTIQSGITLEEARAHCRNPKFSYKTATSKAARNRTRFHGPWSDSYEVCKR